MSAEAPEVGGATQDPDAPEAELTEEERLIRELDAYEKRWGKEKRTAEERRRRLLRRVRVNASDVETVARECELDFAKADLKLREHGGDVASVLRAYIREEIQTLKTMYPEDAKNVEFGLTEEDVFFSATKE
jgi:NACalpha-BTF3-like transcription factor